MNTVICRPLPEPVDHPGGQIEIYVAWDRFGWVAKSPNISFESIHCAGPRLAAKNLSARAFNNAKIINAERRLKYFSVPVRESPCQSIPEKKDLRIYSKQNRVVRKSTAGVRRQRQYQFGEAP